MATYFAHDGATESQKIKWRHRSNKRRPSTDRTVVSGQWTGRRGVGRQAVKRPAQLSTQPAQALANHPLPEHLDLDPATVRSTWYMAADEPSAAARRQRQAASGKRQALRRWRRTSLPEKGSSVCRRQAASEGHVSSWRRWLMVPGIRGVQAAASKPGTQAARLPGCQATRRRRALRLARLSRLSVVAPASLPSRVCSAPTRLVPSSSSSCRRHVWCLVSGVWCLVSILCLAGK